MGVNRVGDGVRDTVRFSTRVGIYVQGLRSGSGSTNIRASIAVEVRL